VHQGEIKADFPRTQNVTLFNFQRTSRNPKGQAVILTGSITWILITGKAQLQERKKKSNLSKNPTPFLNFKEFKKNFCWVTKISQAGISLGR
jgi:hypothetical protein